MTDRDALLALKESAPNPGTREAIDLGCSCPVIDNCHGRGYRGIAGTYVYSAACALHCDDLDEMALTNGAKP